MKLLYRDADFDSSPALLSAIAQPQQLPGTEYRVLKQGNDAQVSRLRFGADEYLLKYYRLTAMYRILPGLVAHRALRACRGSRLLLAAGIPHGKVIALLRNANQAVVVQRYLKNRGSLWSLARESELDRETLISVFRALAAMHGKGLCHGDAKFANVLKTDCALVWVDLEAVTPVSLAHTKQARDLARMLIDLLVYAPQFSVSSAVKIYVEAIANASFDEHFFKRVRFYFQKFAHRHQQRYGRDTLIQHIDEIQIGVSP